MFIVPSTVAVTDRSWMPRFWATAATPAVRQLPSADRTISTGVAPRSSEAKTVGMVGLDRERGVVDVILAEAGEAVDRRAAVRAVDPRGGRAPGEVGRLGSSAERVAGVEQGGGVDAVVDGVAGDGHVVASFCVVVMWGWRSMVVGASDDTVLLAEAGAHQRQVLDAAARPGVGVAVLLDDEVLWAEAATVDVQTPAQLQPSADLTDGGVERARSRRCRRTSARTTARRRRSLPLAKAAREERAERDVRRERHGEQREVTGRRAVEEECRRRRTAGAGRAKALSVHVLRCTTWGRQRLGQLPDLSVGATPVVSRRARRRARASSRTGRPRCGW